jgi:hypothetical protein
MDLKENHTELIENYRYEVEYQNRKYATELGC